MLTHSVTTSAIKCLVHVEPRAKVEDMRRLETYGSLDLSRRFRCNFSTPHARLPGPAFQLWLLPPCVGAPLDPCGFCARLTMCRLSEWASHRFHADPAAAPEVLEELREAGSMLGLVSPQIPSQARAASPSDENKKALVKNFTSLANAFEAPRPGAAIFT